MNIHLHLFFSFKTQYFEPTIIGIFPSTILDITLLFNSIVLSPSLIVIIERKSTIIDENMYYSFSCHIGCHKF